MMMFLRQDCALCVFFFVALSVSSSYGQNVNETVPPLGVEILTRGPLSANKPTQLKCKVTGAGPHTNITWWFQGAILPSTIAQDKKKNITVSLLQFTPLKSDNGRLLKCRAENEEMNRLAVEKEMNMDVYYAPVVTMQLGQYIQPDNLVEHDDIYFVCVVKANPPPREITWEHNGVRLEKNFDIQMAGDALVLQNLSPRFDGDYTCKASNVEGTGVSQPYNLRVQNKPVCRSNENKLIAAKLLEPVKIECEVEAFPSPDAFQWTFNSSDVIVNIDRKRFTVVKEQGKSVLTFTPASDTDYGTLQCWAANSEGRQKSPCTFTIHPPTAPQAPRYCILNTVDTRNTLLACAPDKMLGYTAYENKENITYRAEILTNEGKKVLKPTILPFWEVKSFDAHDSKKIVLYATNEYGESKRTFIVETVYRLSPTTAVEGRCALVWDATCVDTLAMSYVTATARVAGAAAAHAETHKRRKYEYIGDGCIFLPFGVETMGPWGPSAKLLFKDLAKKLVDKTNDPKAKAYLGQRISLATQRGNAASLSGTLPAISDLDTVFLSIAPFLFIFYLDNKLFRIKSNTPPCEGGIVK